MFVLDPLPYEFKALEPHIDTQTMEIHHDKHHAAYVNNLNKAIEAHPELGGKTVTELLTHLDTEVPEDIRTAVRNHGGGHYNHSLFWQLLTPGGAASPEGKLSEMIDKTFGGYTEFKDKFTKEATGLFGSGWVFLSADSDGEGLHIQAMANQDSPLSHGHKPVLGIDVWEHAYYLKYQNKRADYIAAWWSAVNWTEAMKNFEAGGFNI